MATITPISESLPETWKCLDILHKRVVLSICVNHDNNTEFAKKQICKMNHDLLDKLALRYKDTILDDKIDLCIMAMGNILVEANDKLESKDNR